MINQGDIIDGHQWLNRVHGLEGLEEYPANAFLVMLPETGWKGQKR